MMLCLWLWHTLELWVNAELLVFEQAQQYFMSNLNIMYKESEEADNPKPDSECRTILNCMFCHTLYLRVS
jgi:hypothetical protein